MAGNYVEELAAFLGWEVDSKELAKFNDLSNDVVDTVKKVSVAVTAAAAGVAAFVTMTNRATAENYALARSVGISAEVLDALSNTLRPLGMNTENVVDLVEELNNKMGESTGLGEPMTAVAEATKILGLEFQKIKTLAPEDQFIKILDAATKLEDQQQAVSAVDMLMGGEANKILGFLRSQDKEMVELIKHQLQLNFVTDEGRQGAVAFGKSLSDLQGSIGSMGAEFSGLVGAAIDPMLKGMMDLIKANRELIKEKIKIWADRISIAMQWMWDKIQRVYHVVKKVVDAFGGFKNSLKLIGVVMGAVFTTKIIQMVQLLTSAIKAMGIAGLVAQGKMFLLGALLAALALVAEDLYYYFTGGESALGKLGEKIAEFAHTNIRPFIASLLGMTPEELDLALVRVVSSVSNFFTKTIPDLYNWLVEKVEKGITFLMDHIVPVASDIVDVFKEMWATMLTYLGSIGGKILDAITWPFKEGFRIAKSILSTLPGMSEYFGTGDRAGASGIKVPSNNPLAGLRPGSGIAAPGAGMRSGGGGVSNSTSNVKQENNFNITQMPGESSEGLARRIAQDVLNTGLKRAVVAAQSGVE